jgi:predicted negative regulator of RcsB-dependent stress response
VSTREAMDLELARRRARRNGWLLMFVAACAYLGVIGWHVYGGAS